MDLYAAPMACSLACHIAALEVDLPIVLHYVNTATKKTEDGEDYRKIAPNGYVPALRLPTGQILNEVPSVLLWMADRDPDRGLAPAFATFERYQLIDIMNYFSTEVHKRVFYPLFSPSSPAASKEAAKLLLAPTLDSIAVRLGDRPYLIGDKFTVADAYLVTFLNWFRHLDIDLKGWPGIEAYHQRQLRRPAVARAMAEEIREFKRRAA